MSPTARSYSVGSGGGRDGGPLPGHDGTLLARPTLPALPRLALVGAADDGRRLVLGLPGGGGGADAEGRRLRLLSAGKDDVLLGEGGGLGHAVVEAVGGANDI